MGEHHSSSAPKISIISIISITDEDTSALNFQELQQELERLLKLEGWNETNPPPDHASLINEALQMWSWQAEYVKTEATFATVAGTAEYSLDGLNSSTATWK